ncbi:predicted protein [Nematostella vectensis]|uniref:G-protein coupled receptors family 3 profile domain-containing protein n=1 Tax=Nematostella vectensis TaxID=45351 RepID=A7T6W7_NEMVE|nr:predicted protein [Nematostella vectensis]|eukprot:XP_001620386.1 hypothetical protein NEMVEDRAFT_v1g223171 [Nematostella vectensis]
MGKGKVRFDENGDRIGITHILQLQGEQLVLVATFDTHDNKLIFSEKHSFYWPGGSPTKDRIDVEDMMFSVDARLFIVVTVFSFLGISFAAVCLSFNIYFREQRIVKMSSPRLGGITMYVAVVVFGVDGEMVTEQQGTILCQVKMWLASFGFTLLYGALFAKTWRVYAIFSRRTERQVIRDGKLCSIVTALVLLDVLVLSDDDGYLATRSYVQLCSCDYSLVWLGVVYVYKGLLLLFGAFLAWETRNVTFAALNDSRHIAISVYTVLLASVVGIPVVLFTNQFPNWSFALTALIVLACTSLTLALVSVPKMRALRNIPGTCQLATSSKSTQPEKPTLPSKKTDHRQATAVNPDSASPRMSLHRVKSTQNTPL